MSNYTKTTNFTAKDAVEAIISGVDFDNEFDAIASASSTKTDKTVPATANSVAGLNSTGNLYDSTITVAQLTSAVSNAALTGEIKMWPSDTPPSGWLLCAGTSVATASYPDLYAVIGYTFGGSGANFSLPDFRGRVPVGQDDMGGTSANRITDAAADAVGGTGGAETHTLTEAEMPVHTHTASTDTTGAHTHTIATDSVEGGSGDFGTLGAGSTNTGSAGDHSHTVTVDNAGSGDAHSITQPWLAVNFIIKT